MRFRTALALESFARFPAPRPRWSPAPRLFWSLVALAAGCTSGNDGPQTNDMQVAAPTDSVSANPSSTDTGVAPLPMPLTTTAPPATNSAPPLPGTAPSTSSVDTAATSAPTAPLGSGGAGNTPVDNTGGAGGAPVVEVVQRELLSQTGLYSDIASDTLAPGVLAYAPQFQLWTDNADKRRWVYIPEGTQIDNTNPDEWKFPVGTKIWKEFSRDGVRIETRLIEKLPEERVDEGFEGWLYAAYVWNDTLTDAVVTPLGLQNALGTEHDVPDKETCGACHDMRKEKPLGFSAVQLSHSGPGVTLQSLSDSGLLKVPSTGDYVVPGDEATRELLGYLHANCGHCHRQRSPTNNRVASLLLWLETTDLASVETTPAYQALVNNETQSAHGSVNYYRVKGGDPDASEVFRRISERGGEVVNDEGEVIAISMPPVGTEMVDDAAVAMIRSWIESLPPPPEAATGDAGAPPAPTAAAPTPAAGP